MPKYIIKLAGKYMEWSTVVDAPITYGMTLKEFRRYYQQEYGRVSMHDLDLRMERVERKGTSSHLHSSVDDLIECNRAGVNETNISKDEIIRLFANEPKRKRGAK